MVEPTFETMPKPSSDPTLRDILGPLFRHKRVFAYTFCGVLLGTIVAANIFSNTHKASMEILVNQERVEPTVTSESTQAQGSTPVVTDYDIGSEVELLKSPEILQGVVRANNLEDNERHSMTAFLHRGASDDWYLARASEHLGGKLDITPVSKSNLIQVSYKSGSPRTAYNVLQTLGRLYLAKHLEVHRPAGSYAFFASETDKYQRALADAEGRLSGFTKTTGTVAPDLQRAEMAQQVVNTEVALQSAQQTIAADKRRIEEEANGMKATPARSLSAESTDSAQVLMQQLQSGLLAAQMKKTQLLMKYEPTYPLVQEADEEIAETQTAIALASKQQYVNQVTDRDPTYELMREDVARTQADLAFRQATAKALDNSLRSLQAQILDLDQKTLQQGDLSREVKADESNYLLYLSKREQERTSDALDEKRISNVAIAVPPVLPILPVIGPALIVVVGLVLAVFLSTGAAFLAEYLTPSLRTPDEVLEILRIPVLASVPRQTA